MHIFLNFSQSFKTNVFKAYFLKLIFFKLTPFKLTFLSHVLLVFETALIVLKGFFNASLDRFRNVFRLFFELTTFSS